MWTIFKVFKIVAILLLFCFGVFFGHEACGILVAWSGIEHTTHALKDEVLTTGPPGKSHYILTNLTNFHHYEKMKISCNTWSWRRT